MSVLCALQSAVFPEELAPVDNLEDNVPALCPSELSQLLLKTCQPESLCNTKGS